MCEDSDTYPKTRFLSYINGIENIRLKVHDGQLFTIISLPYGENNATLKFSPKYPINTKNIYSKV
jgi:hypothetical protein